jgi:ABC-type amino acid transport substrate-binding protein
LIAGVRYDLQPFGFVTDDGQLAGLDVDIARELARRWLSDSDAVIFKQVRSDTAVEHLQSGAVDIVLAAFVHTQSDEAGADYSVPYFIDGHALLVRGEDAQAIVGPGNLAGWPVGVVAGEGTEDVLASAVPFTLTLQTYSRFDSAVAALGRAEVVAVADLRHRLFWGTRMLPGSIVVGQYTSAPVAIAFPPNDDFFADLVNLTLQDMVADGTLADMYGRWLAPETIPSVEHWPGTAPAPQLSEAPVALEAAPGTVAKIQSRGRLAVTVIPDRAPFAYLDATGALAGYEIGLVGMLAERWLGDPTAVDFALASAEQGPEVLKSGQADVLVGALVHSREAERQIDFSRTIYVAGESLMVQAGVPISGLAELQGQQIAVVEGTTSGELVLSAAQASGVALSVTPVSDVDLAIVLLQEGRVAAIAGDRRDLLGPAYATSGLGLLPLRLTEVPIALGLPPGDSEFRDLVNMTLQAMKADGQLDARYAVWFTDDPPPMLMWPGAPYRTLHVGDAAPAAEG